MNPNYFIHAANVLLLVAYSVRDILWLRLFAVGASVISLPSFVLQPTPQWPPIIWSVLFAGINAFQSWRLYLERRSVALTPDEEDVRKLAFAHLPPRKVVQLVSVGSWTTAATGERLIENGTPAAGSHSWSAARSECRRTDGSWASRSRGYRRLRALSSAVRRPKWTQ